MDLGRLIFGTASISSRAAYSFMPNGTARSLSRRSSSAASFGQSCVPMSSASCAQCNTLRDL